MKHTRLLLLAAALALSLTACSGSQSNTPPEPDTSDPDVPETEAPAAEAPPFTPEEAYGKILLDIYEKGVLPDIYEKGISPDGLKLCAPEEDPHEKAANNDFSIYDVDNDGNVELLLLWADDCVAGRIGIVYGYQDGEVYSELMEYPALTFYENGIVTQIFPTIKAAAVVSGHRSFTVMIPILTPISISARSPAGIKPFRRVWRASPPISTPMGTAWYTSTPIFRKTRTAPIRRWTARHLRPGGAAFWTAPSPWSSLCKS